MAAGAAASSEYSIPELRSSPNTQPTPGSGPRRGDIDSKDRYWTSLYWAGRIAVFEPNNGQIKEFPLIPDVKPYGAPYLAPYRVSVDNKHQLAWTTDFNSSRLYRFDIKTEKTTEYYMPQPFEARDIKADNHADRQTVWFPAYRPPSKVVRVEVW
jgi:streptogramin lyase